ncbi:DUF4351 domain-containing protein [Dactylococcopsis salina]|uniref:DUF4351 domain-containing protein n=1 Tax=Dactylococcopsis salina TaxID=292566 RepID=UPI0002EB0833|nr:DUF4351 domain-containing protein [Dactylococcopsis salina]
MGETPPCEYQFRAQEVKAFGFRTDGLMFPRSTDPNHPIILLEAQTKAKALLQRSQQELSEPSQRDNFVELLIELITRIFPEQSKEEVKRMLELVPVKQTRFYREVQEEATRSLVIRLLSRRFGEIPSTTQTQIEQLNLEQTESLAEALLDFTSLDDLTNWLEQSGNDNVER